MSRFVTSLLSHRVTTRAIARDALKTRSSCLNLQLAQKKSSIPDNRAPVSLKSGRKRSRSSLSVPGILKEAALVADWRPSDRVITWLHSRGYDGTDVAAWKKITGCLSAEMALSLMTPRTPVYVILKTLSKPTRSRQTFYRLVCLYQQSIKAMDDLSRYYAFCILLKRAKNFKPFLLNLLGKEFSLLPKSLTSFHFNHFLRIVSEGTSGEPQLYVVQATILEEMQNRGFERNLEGYVALLAGYVDVPAKMDQIQEEMTKAGHSLTAELRRHINRRDSHESTDRQARIQQLSRKIRTTRSMTACLDEVEAAGFRHTDVLIWHAILKHYPRSEEAVRYCINLILNRQLIMTAFLTGSLLEVSRMRDIKSSVSDVSHLAVAQNVTFTPFVWIEYLRCLIDVGRAQDVVEILVNEPGGNYLLDMDSTVRRDSSVWTSVLQALNSQVRAGHMTGSRHARHMGKLVAAIARFEITSTPSLVLFLLNAAIFSGPRQWSNVHACDTIVRYFTQEVDTTGEEPWKVPASETLWRAYMQVLVVNEETSLLVDAMICLLRTRERPSTNILRLFALGIWESGSIESLDYWSRHFEQHLNLEWPTSEEAFAMRKTLELHYFYE